MAIEVVDQHFFHINKQVSYSPHKPMSVGDVIEAGSQSNPFFRFYETTNSSSWNPADAFNLIRELVWENIRLKEFGGEPSRQRCLWVVETEEQARAWMKIPAANLRVVRIRASGRLAKVDCKHLPLPTAPMPQLAQVYESARRYWRGQLTAYPQSELLFEGTATVEEAFTADEIFRRS